MRFARLLAASLLLAAIGITACEGDSSPADGNGFGLDGGFGVDGATGDGAASDGAATPDGDDAATDPDAGDLPLTTTLTNVPVGDNAYGAASSDGSAMIVVVTAGQVSRFTHYEPATGWTAGAALPGATTGQAFQLVMDGHGNAFLAWASGGGTPAAQVAVVRYDHATHAWSAVQHPDPYATGLDSTFGLVANASGEALLMTHHLGAAPFDLVAQHYVPASGTWTQEAVTTPPVQGSFSGGSLSTGMTDGGRAVVVWRQVQGFQIATRDTAGAWTLQPPTPDGVTGDPSVAINEVGDILVGYETLNDTPGATHYDAATTTWASPVVTTIQDSGNLVSCHVKVALTPTGDGSLVRCFLTNSLVQIEGYSFSKSTTTWGPKATLASTATIFVRGPRFAQDASGNTLVTFTSEPDGNTAVPAPQLTSVYAPATGWAETAAPLTAKGTYEQDIAFAAPNGRGFVAWVEGSSFLVKKVR